MGQVIILVTLTLIVLLFVFFSRASRDLVNVFTPYIMIIVPSRYMLELIHLQYFGQQGSLYAYFVVYSSYALEFIGMLIGFLIYRGRTTIQVPLFSRVKNSPRLAWVLLTLSIVVFLPVLAEYSNLIFSPRELYMRTRTGYGPYFFGSIALGYLSFVAYLFSGYWRRFSSVFYCIGLLVSLMLHGNKAAIINIIFIYLLYRAYVLKQHTSFFMFAKGIAAFVLVIIMQFYLTFSDEMRSDFVIGVSSYSDYSRNAMLVIDNPPAVKSGRLTIENNIISLMPRILYPGKPKNFGTFYLAEFYYPEWFEVDTGSPAFGFGVQYADFRIFGLLYVFLTSLIIGFFIKLFLNRVMRYQSPADFILLLFFCGVPFVELGAGYHAIPHYLLALFYIFISRLNQIRISAVQKTYSSGSLP